MYLIYYGKKLIKPYTGDIFMHKYNIRSRYMSYIRKHKDASFNFEG